MARIVNLRTARKQRARDAARERATRATPDAAEAARARAEGDRERTHLEGHRREGRDEDGSGD